MITDFKYTDNPEAEVPRMFIDKVIGGEDAKGRPNIDGNEFLKELLFLSDEMGKKNIQVWINSEGGSVIEGMSIYYGILACKANVDTLCYGMAASMAGVIFQAGRKKIMTDFATLMYHNPYDPANPKEQRDDIDAMKTGLCTMISKRTGKEVAEITRIMNRESWITAQEALDNGFCDEIQHSNEKNKKRMLSTTGVLDRWETANMILNRITEKPKIKNMDIVAKRVGLVSGSNEDSILNAINAMEAKASENLTAVKNSLEDMNKKYADKCAEYEAVKAEKDTLAKAVNDAKIAADAAALVDIENKAKTLVAEAVKLGKIKNEATIIEKWESKAKADFDGMKDILDSTPGNKVSAVFTKPAAPATAKSAAELSAIKNGIKVGTAAWYNHIKKQELETSK